MITFMFFAKFQYSRFNSLEAIGLRQRAQVDRWTDRHDKLMKKIPFFLSFFTIFCAEP